MWWMWGKENSYSYDFMNRGFTKPFFIIATLVILVVGTFVWYSGGHSSKLAAKADCSSYQDEALARACVALAGTVVPIPGHTGTSLTIEYRPGGFDLGPSWVAYTADSNISVSIFPHIKVLGNDGGETWYAVPLDVHTNSPNRTNLYLGLFSLSMSSTGPLIYHDAASIGSQIGYGIFFREPIVARDGSIQVPYVDMRDENGNMLKSSKEDTATFVRSGDKLIRK